MKFLKYPLIVLKQHIMDLTSEINRKDKQLQEINEILTIASLNNETDVKKIIQDVKSIIAQYKNIDANSPFKIIDEILLEINNDK